MNAISTRKLLAGSSLMLVAGYFIVGMWPFAFRPPNRVTWRTDRTGLHFEPNAIAYVPDFEPPAPMTGSPGQAAEFTVELWVEPGLASTSDLLHILTIDDGRLPPDFALCQWNSEFLLRTTAPNHQPASRIRETGKAGVLEKQKPAFVTVTGNRSGIDLYVNGRPAKHVPDFIVDPSVFAGQLILGNSSSGKHSWTGELFGLAMFNRALVPGEVLQHYELWTNQAAAKLADESALTALYLFDEHGGTQALDLSSNHRHLLIPSVYSVPHKEVLISPWRDLAFDLTHPIDIFLNILGFVPFGFCFFRYRELIAPHRRGNVLLVILAGFLISLAIELIQVWLPNRVSSCSDLLCNTTGTLIGVTLFIAMRRRRVAHSSTP